MKQGSNLQKIGIIATSAFVVANMIGTGVFTSLGYQLKGINNVVAVLSLWVIGGIVALCGALVYGELGAAMPRSGGEYHYLTKIYHPVVGFLSGWVSMTVGFAAPVALASMALGSYTARVFPDLSPVGIALCSLIGITAIHCYNVKFGSAFQTVFTTFKVLLILTFIICGFVVTPSFQNLSGYIKEFSFKSMLSPGYVVSLVYVTYAFSGWNSSAYIANEIKDPQRNIPRSLFFSTLLVTILYLLLNYIFLLTAPVSELMGQVEVGFISAGRIFGATGGNIMGIFISILLISSISSMIFVGPRVSQVMGEDMAILRFLSYKTKRGTPLTAILLQCCISFIMIMTSTFDKVLVYAGFTLNLFTFLTVLGVFIHRAKYKDAERPYKTWGYPVVPILFLCIILMVMGYLLYNNTMESFMGLATVLCGIILYFINKWFEKPIAAN
jgi:APA family basic amino acid/polyamine antiporter